MKEMSSSTRTILALIALVVGLFIVFVGPGFFDTTMDTLIFKQSKQATDLHSGPLSRLYVGYIYHGFEIAAGLALIAMSAALYLGKKWAWAVTVILLAIPAAGNVYIGLGWIENLKQFPPAYFTWILSLLAFWAVLFLGNFERKTKTAMFWVFTLLGMLAAQGFALFPHSLRVILRDPAQTLLDPTVAILRRAGPLMFIGTILPLVAIYLLARRRESGWWFALVSGAVMAVGAFPVHYLRPTASLVPADTLEASIFTSTYWMAGAQGVILIVLLLIPFFRNRLFDKEI